MFKDEDKTVCKKCGKNIIMKEAREACALRCKNMSDSNPKMFDAWFEDWCLNCAEKENT